MSFTARAAQINDAAAITSVYNEGIADRVATFETEARLPEQIADWFDGRHPIVVVEYNAIVIGFASCSSYRSRDCYAGVAEFSVYVARRQRGTGVGRIAMATLIEAARTAGFWKLVSRVFPANSASLALMARLGFREVGTYQRHGRLNGHWRDRVIVELLLGDARA